MFSFQKNSFLILVLLLTTSIQSAFADMSAAEKLASQIFAATGVKGICLAPEEK